MGDDIDEVIVRVRADTAAFARDVATMRGELEGPLANGVARAGRTIEGTLGRAITSGKLGFDDLKRVALRALGEIAAASLRGLLAPRGWLRLIATRTSRGCACPASTRPALVGTNSSGPRSPTR